MNKMRKLPAKKHSQGGMAIVETMVAILIFSTGILATAALQNKMLRHSADSNYRAAATSMAQERLGRMWLSQANLAAFVESNVDISSIQPYLLPNGKRTVTVNNSGEVRVTITWKPPGQDSTNSVVLNSVISGGV